jgi:TRAP-type C4-dicarboxylate transport system permease small subunit
MPIAQTISDFLMLYLCGGLFFGCTFITAGVAKVDSAARGSSVLFRLLILPATVAFWPFLLAQWIKTARHRVTP